MREVLRNRFDVGYDIPKFKLDPAFSVEFFTWAGYEGLIYFGTRYKLGTEWSPEEGSQRGPQPRVRPRTLGVRAGIPPDLLRGLLHQPAEDLRWSGTVP